MQVGFGKGKITPTGGKIVIAGKIPVRYTDVVHDDVWAVAMVIQHGDTRTIWVSCDMCHPTRRLTEDVIAGLKAAVADFKEEELILNATHATACFYLTDDEFLNDGIRIDYNEIMPLAEARKQVCDGIIQAVLQAISNMENCTMEFATADILTGFCRRVVYKDGRAVMYGNPHKEDFLRIEYPDGGATQILYFYTEKEHKLMGIFADVPCPAQADERSVHITGDYWTTVRKRICEAFGENVAVVAACRAAGELSPHRIIYTAGSYSGDEWGVHKAERLGNLIADSIIREKERPLKTYNAEELVHGRRTEVLRFPVRMADASALNVAVRYFEDPDNFEPSGQAKKWMEQMRHAHIKKLFREKLEFYEASVSVMRIADILFFTAPMELFAEYSRRICMKFPQNPVFDIQLVNDCLGYLPTKEAIAHGGYSTDIFSTLTTPEGGEMFIDEVSKLLAEIAQ